MEKCIEEDVKKEYPQDEEGLKLQVIWKEAEKPIQELQKEFYNSYMTKADKLKKEVKSTIKKFIGRT